MSSWVIVGASRGIGYQYLKTLSHDPTNTIVGIVRTLETTRAKVTSDHLENVHVIDGDLDDVASLKRAAGESSVVLNGTVDHLVLNGAYKGVNSMLLDPEDYTGKEEFLASEMTNAMNTNAIGVLCAINAFLPLIRKSSVKKVIAISSGAADIGVTMTASLSGHIPYSVSKAALNLIIAKYACAHRTEGIVFLALHPGYVYTATEDLKSMPDRARPVFEHLTKTFQALKPGLEGPGLPYESVEKQLKVIEGLSMEQSGSFLSLHGNKEWI